MFRLMRETRGQAVRSVSLCNVPGGAPFCVVALGGEFPSPPTCGLSCRAVPIQLIDVVKKPFVFFHKPEKKLNFFLLASKKIHAVACPSENRIKKT